MYAHHGGFTLKIKSECNPLGKTPLQNKTHHSYQIRFCNVWSSLFHPSQMHTHRFNLPYPAAGNHTSVDCTVGGNWHWSPTRTKRCEPGARYFQAFGPKFRSGAMRLLGCSPPNPHDLRLDKTQHPYKSASKHVINEYHRCRYLSIYIYLSYLPPSNKHLPTSHHLWIPGILQPLASENQRNNSRKLSSLSCLGSMKHQRKVVNLQNQGKNGASNMKFVKTPEGDKFGKSLELF